MRAWRIAPAPWATDKVCKGSRDYGGRWNPVGMAALYAGSTPELCALEYFVHLSGPVHPPLKLVAVDIPDDPELMLEVSTTALPPDWNSLPVSAGSQSFGGRWLAQAQQLVLLLPSVIVPESRNLLINPAHPRYRDVRLTILRDFAFDGRMLAR